MNCLLNFFFNPNYRFKLDQSTLETNQSNLFICLFIIIIRAKPIQNLDFPYATAYRANISLSQIFSKDKFIIFLELILLYDSYNVNFQII